MIPRLRRRRKLFGRCASGGGNNANALDDIDAAPPITQQATRQALLQLLDAGSIGAGLDSLSDIPGLRLVMATKLFRFCVPERGVAVDRHASYFFNSLDLVGDDGPIRKATHFTREWLNGPNTSSRLAIYAAPGHRANTNEFVQICLPLLHEIATALNAAGDKYHCADTGQLKQWRPADVEMAAYYWWARHGAR